MSLLRRTDFARALLRSSRTSASASANSAPLGGLAARAYTTPSEEAAKGEKHNKSPEQLQKEHTPASSGGANKHTASPNDQPTQSEDTVHAEKQAGNKTPEQLQKETVAKHQ
ncbi:hypothetical protein OC844_000318 [Tilletia horrida]|nr:hypothetical protein OC844_000318 [Tilletia horrida]